MFIPWQWCLQVPGTAGLPSLYTPVPWWLALVGFYTIEEDSPAAPVPLPPAGPHEPLQSWHREQVFWTECATLHIVCVNVCTNKWLYMCALFLWFILYLAWSCRVLRSCCSSSAAALESVRQAVGTSATGAFCCWTSGGGRGAGCFCKLDRIRSLAAHRDIEHNIKTCRN